MPFWKTRTMQPVGRAHRQQVHDDRLGRHDDAAEDEHQQQEAETKHEGEDDRRVAVGQVVEVLVERRLAADVEPCAGTPLNALRDVVRHACASMASLAAGD